MRVDNTTRTTTGFATEIIVRQEGLPAEIRRPFLRTIGQMQSAEQMVWREVAARMTLDALGQTPDTINVTDGMDKYKFNLLCHTVTKARTWFMSHRRDSDLVFEMAGVDIYPVRLAVSRLKPIQPPKYFAASKPRKTKESRHEAQASV